jgi:hypothetical protein
MGQNRDCLTCPAHQNSRSTYSQWVWIFHVVISEMAYPGVVIFYWNDVPENRHMHWDATLFLGGMAHRFEVDGPRHRIVRGVRLLEDIQKDHIVNTRPAISLLRLSHHDVHAWPTKILLYLQSRMQLVIHGVWATEWYRPFQGQGDGSLNII